MATVTQEYDFGVPAKRRRSASGAPGRDYVRRGYKYVAPSARFRKRVPKAVRAYVRSAVSRSLEVKRAFVNAANANIYGAITLGTCYSCVPSLSQGTTQGTRIGNSITLKKVVVRMQIMGALTTGPACYVDIYFFRRRPNASIANVDLNFLQAGNTAVGYDSDVLPYCGMLSVNDDLFEPLMHKRVKVWNPTNAANVGVQAAIQPCYTQSFDITSMMRKKVMYNDSTSTPTSDDVYFAIGSTFVNGVTSSGNVTNLLTYVIEHQYTDA